MVFALLLGKQCARLSERGCYYNVVALLLRFQILTKELEPSCYKKRQKSPSQKTGLGNRGRLNVLNDTKLVLNEHELHP